jgi:hypothetical protein
MGVQEILTDAITTDFLQPTIDRLSEQLRRNIALTVKLALDGQRVQRRILSVQRDGFQKLDGEVRIIASNTAVNGRYKYNLQCVLPEQDELEGFSGIRLNGAVFLDGSGPRNDYSGFLYTYNEWGWGKKLRDM